MHRCRCAAAVPFETLKKRAIEDMRSVESWAGSRRSPSAGRSWDPRSCMWYALQQFLALQYVCVDPILHPVYSPVRVPLK